MSRKRPKERDIRCPFFIKMTTTSVTCEAVSEKGRYSTLTFANENTFALFAEDNCCKNYPPCKIYQLLQEKYKK